MTNEVNRFDVSLVLVVFDSFESIHMDLWCSYNAVLLHIIDIFVVINIVKTIIQ